jgi:hypothetical protein
MEHCHPASERKANKSASAFAKKYSSILGIVILALPKCPLCIAAYSGAVAICGVSPLIVHHQNQTDWRTYVVLVISVMITGCILFTYRARTYYKMTMAAALCGLVLICIGTFSESLQLFRTDYNSVCYYAGAALLAAALLMYSGIAGHGFKTLKQEVLQSKKYNSSSNFFSACDL